MSSDTKGVQKHFIWCRNKPLEAKVCPPVSPVLVLVMLGLKTSCARELPREEALCQDAGRTNNLHLPRSSFSRGSAVTAAGTCPHLRHIPAGASQAPALARGIGSAFVLGRSPALLFVYFLEINQEAAASVQDVIAQGGCLRPCCGTGAQLRRLIFAPSFGNVFGKHQL